MAGAVVMAAHGKRRVASVDVHAYAKGQSGGRVATLPCDLLAMSGGLSPVLHLHAQSGGKPQWLERKACFVPGKSVQAEASVGAAAASSTCVSRWRRQPALAPKPPAPPASPSRRRCPFPGGVHRRDALMPLWLAGGRTRARGKQFVDFQNDVAASDILLAAREGFESVEHVKRYTAMGFGTDQGKLGNINGMAILAQALGKSIPETGTTTYRPNYTPVSFGAFAGRELGEFLDPVRKTCLHEWHAGRGALFGTWATGSGPGTTRGGARTCTPPCAASAWRCATASASWMPPRWARSISRDRTRWPC